MKTNGPSQMCNQMRERLDCLVDLLRDGTCPGRQELSRRLEVHVRTVQRDVDFLRDRMGAPIVYDKQEGGYRLTEASWFLPRINLTEGELFALLVARQAMAQYRGTPIEKTLDQIFNKISGELQDHISIHQNQITGGLISFAPSPVLQVNESVWNTLLAGARERRIVKIRYRSLRSKTTSTRKVDPYHIINMQGDWYLFARDHRSGEIRQFQLHRVQRASPTEAHFHPDPNFDPAEIVNSCFGSFGDCDEMVSMRLRIRGAMADLLADRVFHPAQTVAPCEGGFEIAFPVSASGDRPFLHVIQWILGMGEEVTVLEPPELHHQLASTLHAMTENLGATS